LYSITRDFPLMTSKPMKGSAQEVLGVTKGGWGVVHSPRPQGVGGWGCVIPQEGCRGGIKSEDKLRYG